MKKIFSFAMAAALAFGLASCSKDAEMNGGAADDGNAAFQFSLKTAKGNYVTYADIATAPEWAVSNVSMYIFNAVSGDTDEGKLIGTNSDFDETTNSADHGAAVLTAKSTWLASHKGKAVNVYFVGNKGANSTDGTAHASLAAVSGTTTEAAFVELLTDVQTNDGTKANKLKTPLLFSASAATTVPSMGKVVVPVQLKRREARFDIVNSKKDAFEINKVIVKNAAIEGYIFADNTATFAGLTHKNIEEIAPVAYDATDATLMPSAFYLYPTQLGVGANTEISIVATVDGKQSAYPVNSSAKIDANKRYKLVLKDTPYGLVFDVVVADYDEGEDFDIVPMDALTISGLSIASGNASLDNINSLIHIVPNDGASTVSLTTFASSNAGVSVTTENILGTGPAIEATTNTTDTNITYSNIGYKTSLVLTIPEYTGTESFQTLVTITDKNLGVKGTIVVYHESGALVEVDGEQTYMYPTAAGSIPAVKVGDMYVAPVHVGATSIGADGYSFQWGRNTPLTAPASSGVGRLTIEQASAYANSNTIIGVAAENDWLTISDDNLWTGANAQGPCPSGWRVPTKEECGAVTGATETPDLFGSSLTDCFEFEHGDKTLYFPKQGWISIVSGLLNLKEIEGYVWTSTPSTNGESYAIHLTNYPGTTPEFIGKNVRALTPRIRRATYAVRCIKATN